MEWLIYSLISLLLMGLLNVVLKLAAGKVDSILMVFLTGFFAAIFLFPLVVVRGGLKFSFYGLVGGLLWALAVVSLMIALNKAEVSRVLPIVSLSGAFVALVGIIFLKETVTLFKIIGIILSAIAIILLSI